MNLDPASLHIPVLCDELVSYLIDTREDLAERESLNIIDMTLGLGGHSFALLNYSEKTRVKGVDRDPQAIELATQRLEQFGDRFETATSAFADIELEAQGYSGIMADIGLSSMQLDDPERGFAFRYDSQLDMRMGPDCERDAADIVNNSNEVELARILFEYGEEKRSRKIAAAIVQARKLAPIETTTQLAGIIRRNSGPARQNNRKIKNGSRAVSIDPATKSFQALRIAVNDELGQLSRALPRFLEALENHGRLVIISFHSLEDRIVKNCFRDWKKAGLGKVLTKQPVTATAPELARNPRARSAKMRVFERIID